MNKTNLNKLEVVTDYNEGLPLLNNNFKGENISVFFREIKENLIKEIEKADIIVGCVAWMTSEDILNALCKKKVSIIIQKEDFLRPEIGEFNNWKIKLRGMYNKFNKILSRFDDLPGSIKSMSYCSYDAIQPIRCCGVYNNSKQKPNMHNKFLVFCKKIINKKSDGTIENPDYFIKPYAVWTGSYNFSKNSELSFENGILIKDFEISIKYMKEWSNICSLSESLDWTNEYVAPEWRIGS